MIDNLSWREYEQLTRALVERIASQSMVTTTRLEHNVKVEGRSTTWQIDVLWEFEVEGSQQRVIFECKHHKDRVEQSVLGSLKLTVDDVDVKGLPTTGVLVTSNGFQSGAKGVASTYGIVVLEMRDPTDADLADRVTAINVDGYVITPVWQITKLDAIESFGTTREGEHVVAVDDLIVRDESGIEGRLVDLLQEGQPIPVPIGTQVTRQFDPPTIIVIGGEPQMRVREVVAVAAERSTRAFQIRVGGREQLAWVVKNALNGSSAWFMDDGKIHYA